ncbi:hypothetical protein [Brevibacterium jeotgali]|uniref:hypothetical protein n=1 Tax=Brevibacterium jeotgali TaxID=1262550 RepID=UPI00119F3FC2|nr:hypothetical protein [Brevibacterium jeotgali]
MIDTVSMRRSRDLPDDEDADVDFHERLAALELAVVSDRLGIPELATTAERRRSEWEHDATHVREAAVAVDATGRDVGAWVVDVPVRDNLDTADVQVLDPPLSAVTDSEADDLHAALLADALATVRRHGRHVVFTHEVLKEVVGESLPPHVLEPVAGGPADADLRFAVVWDLPAGSAIPARSGSGAVSRSDRSVRRMTAAGFVPVQLERFSVLDLIDSGGTGDPHPSLRSVSWVDDAPVEWAAQLADLYSVFEATVPTGGASFDPEVWDVARLRAVEATARAAGVVRVVSAVAEGPRLLAFTVFEQTPGSPLVFQEHTVVRPEVRGLGLAAAVKRANAAHLRAVSPDAVTVCTWNAVENPAMIAVNTAAGFRPWAFTVLWELRLDR